MSTKVFDGVAELDITKFLNSLNKMESAAVKSVNQIATTLKSLDQQLNSTLSGYEARIKGVAQGITSIGRALSGAQAAAAPQNTPAAQQAIQQQQRQIAQKQSLRRQELAAERADQQRALLQLRQYLADQERAVRQAANQSADELRIQARQLKEELRTASDPSVVLKIKQAYAEMAKDAADAFAKERQEIEKNIAEQQKLAREKLELAAKVSRSQTPGVNSAAAEKAYREARAAAQRAQEEEASLQRRLTTIIQAERRAQSAAAERAAQVAVSAQQQLAREGALGFRAQMRQTVEDVQDNLKRTEDSLNSIYRAGTQLSSLGQQMFFFAATLTTIGYGLSKNAGEFDFWSRRLVAAARSALAPEEAMRSTIVTVENYQNAILELGRGLGILAPEEVAEGWTLYQAALGKAIQTQEDFVASRNAVDAILRAAVITGTDAATAIKGVVQAMAEFGLQQEQAGYATAVMLNLTQVSGAEFTDVLEGFKMVGPLANSLGVDIAEAAALMARLSDYGLKGSMAGRGLQMVLSRLLDTTGPADDALQHLFITSQGLTGSWRDVVFEGGHFIGLLDDLNEKGEVVHRGFLSRFAELTKDMTEAQRGNILAEIFPENAMRNILPLVEEYVYRLQTGADTTATGKEFVDQLALSFRDVNEQAALFGSQWEIVGESVKVRLGQVTYGLQESLIRIGLIVADVFIPVLEWVNRAIAAFMRWAESHPTLARGLIAVAAGLAAVAGIFGPVLFGIGMFLQGVAGIRLALTAFAGLQTVVAKALAGLLPAITSLGAPIFALIAAVTLLALAWRNNWFGIGDLMNSVAAGIGQSLQGLSDAFGGFLTLLDGLFSGSSEKVREGMRAIGVGLIEAVLVLGENILPALLQVTDRIVDWSRESLGGLVESMAVWGHNLMVALANGIIDGAQYVWEAASGVAEGIARFFRSFSPPRFGPLQGIFVWGRNLVGAFIEGMNAADLTAVEDIAGRIGEALKVNIQAGNFDPGMFRETAILANQRVAEMLQIVRGGGRVTAEFFEGLREGLGEWYDGVISVALAYQEVYAVQGALEIEKERLEVIQQQRSELERQNRLRQDAFDSYLRGTDTTSFEANSADIVDPTTPEGRRQIDRMRQTLSREEFQNWLNFQKRLWEQKTQAEDAPLRAQEEATQSAVDAYERQLELVKAQYDYFVRMYEFAQQMFELQKEEDRLLKEREQKEKESKPRTDLIGDPEDLEAYRREIDAVTGEDFLIEDEDQLTERLKEAKKIIEGAANQRLREQERIDELEKLNRKRRAEFEAELINATSKEEQDAIKRRKDAWDAAYREEKARLQERLELERDIEAVVKAAYETEKEPKGPKEKEPYAPPAFPASTGPFVPQLTPDEIATQWVPPWAMPGEEATAEDNGPVRESKLRAIKLFDDLGRAFKFLGDESIPARTKIEELGKAISEFFTGDTKTFEDAKRGADWLGAGMPEWDKVFGIDQIVGPFQRWFDTIGRGWGVAERGVRDWLDTVGRGTEEAKRFFGDWFDTIERGWGVAKDTWDRTWEGVKQNLENFFSPISEAIGPLKDELQRFFDKLLETDRWWNEQKARLQESVGKFSLSLLSIIGDILKNILQAIIDHYSRQFQSTVEALGRVWQFLLDWWEIIKRGWGVWLEAIEKDLSAWWDLIQKGWDEAFKIIGGWLTDWWEAKKKEFEDGLKFWGDRLTEWRDAIVAKINEWTSQWKDFNDFLDRGFAEVKRLGTEAVDAIVAKLDEWTAAVDEWWNGEDGIKAKWQRAQDSIRKSFQDWTDSVDRSLKGITDSLGGALDTLRRKAEEIWSWISGQRRKAEEANKGGSGGGGGGVDGSLAGGLAYVPFDGYRAELHKGERVLTSAEAGLYKVVERSGLLDTLARIVSGAADAAGRVSSATAAASVQMADSRSIKIVQVDVARIDATNPDEGRAFVTRLAHLS